MQKKNSNALTIKETSELIQGRKADIALFLGKELDAPEVSHFIKQTMMCCHKNQALLECSKESIAVAILEAAETGLPPGYGPLAQAYLIPRWNKKTQRKEACYQCGYQGLMDLARKSGAITHFYVNTVCEHDDFEAVAGENPQIVRHVINYREPRGEAYAYYVVVTLGDGTKQSYVMSKHEIEPYRLRSTGAEGEFWRNNYDSMARKTVIRQALKYLPYTPQLIRAVEIDSQIYEYDEVEEPKVTAKSRRAAMLPPAEQPQELVVEPAPEEIPEVVPDVDQDPSPATDPAPAPANDELPGMQEAPMPAIMASDASLAKSLNTFLLGVANAEYDGDVNAAALAYTKYEDGDMSVYIPKPEDFVKKSKQNREILRKVCERIEALGHPEWMVIL